MSSKTNLHSSLYITLQRNPVEVEWILCRKGVMNWNFTQCLWQFCQLLVLSRATPGQNRGMASSLQSYRYTVYKLTRFCVLLSWQSSGFGTSKDHSLLAESHQVSEENEIPSMCSKLEQSTKAGRISLSQCVLRRRKNYWELLNIYQSLQPLEMRIHSKNCITAVPVMWGLLQ